MTFSDYRESILMYPVSQNHYSLFPRVQTGHISKDQDLRQSTAGFKELKQGNYLKKAEI